MHSSLYITARAKVRSTVCKCILSIFYSPALTMSQYARITLNRVTTAFFIFSFVHCFAQGIIQSFLFSIDTEYNTLLSSITTAAHIPVENITYLEGPSGNYDLRICNDIPHGQPIFPCSDIFRSAIDANMAPVRHISTEIALDLSQGLVIGSTFSSRLCTLSSACKIPLAHQSVYRGRLVITRASRLHQSVITPLR